MLLPTPVAGLFESIPGVTKRFLRWIASRVAVGVLLGSLSAALAGPGHGVVTGMTSLDARYLDHAAPTDDEAPLPALLRPDRLESRNAQGLTPLLVTALQADLATASVLMDLGSDPRATDPEGNTVLHRSIRNPRRNSLTLPPSDWLERRRRHPVGTWLLQDFVWPEPTPVRRTFDLFFSVFLDIDIVPRRETPIMDVPSAVAFFLASGADVRATNQAGQSALSMALDPREFLGESERVQLLSVLQKASRSLDAPDSAGDTTLHHLARQGWESEILAAVLAAGADVRRTNAMGRTPLHEAAAAARDSRLLSALLKARPSIDARDADGRTALHLAAASGVADRPRVFEALLAAGADPQAVDRNGRTAVHLLLEGAWPWNGVAECLAMLVRSGARLGAADQQGRTPLHGLASLRGGNNPLFFLGLPGNLFLPDRVDFNARDSRGDTPLHLAAREGGQELFEWFVARGARLDATNALGETPARLASATDFPSIAASRTAKTDLFLAIEAGDAAAVASIVASDPGSMQRARPDGLTPLRRAVDLKRTAIIDLLHGHGVAWDPFSAVIGRRHEVLRDLLVRSPGVITNAVWGRGLLHAAAEHADIPILKNLLAAGADPKALDPWGLSPLGIAMVTGRREIEVQLRAMDLRESVFDSVYLGRIGLLKDCIRLDPGSAQTQNGFGVSPAAVAVALDRPELLEVLLRAGVSPDHTEPHQGRSLLHFAAIRNATNAIGLLLQAGARSEVFDARGLTPLHHAASAGAGDAVRLLLTNGANLETRSRPARPQFRGTMVDFTGGTPLHLAAISAETNSLKALLEAGASTIATDALGRRPRDLVVTPESRLLELEASAMTLCSPAPGTRAFGRRDLERQQQIARQWLSQGRRPGP
jgi:ankyrin repeat protein